jgi:hypothetical protein
MNCCLALLASQTGAVNKYETKIIIFCTSFLQELSLEQISVMSRATCFLQNQICRTTTKVILDMPLHGVDLSGVLMLFGIYPVHREVTI